MIFTSYSVYTLEMLEYAPSPGGPATLTLSRTFLQVSTGYKTSKPVLGSVTADGPNAQLRWHPQSDGNVCPWNWTKETA
jgi:hypothetical protein